MLILLNLVQLFSNIKSEYLTEVTAKEIIRDFETKNKYTSLLNGSNSLHLLENHGHKAKIDLKEAKKTFSN